MPSFPERNDLEEKGQSESLPKMHVAFDKCSRIPNDDVAELCGAFWSISGLVSDWSRLTSANVLRVFNTPNKVAVGSEVQREESSNGFRNVLCHAVKKSKRVLRPRNRAGFASQTALSIQKG